MGAPPSIKSNQLRKPIAILLLLAFCWAQYVKQVMYLECRIANSFRSYAVTCDCEKKAGLTENPGNNAPLSSGHPHIHPDDLFLFTRMIIAGFSGTTPDKGHWFDRDESVVGDWYSDLLRPPQHTSIYTRC